MMPTKTVKLGVLTTGIDRAISDMGKLREAEGKVGGDTTVRIRLADADITEEKLAALSAEIKAITDKGATVRVNMAGGTGEIEKATADAEALSMSGAKVSTSLEEAGAKAEGAGSKIKNGLGGALSNLGLTPFTAGLAGAGIAMAYGVKQSIDYQKELALLVTDAGESKSNLGMVATGIESIAEATGTNLSQLTSGMFMIESAGYHGAAGLTVLRAASEGAKTSGADLGTTADALTTVMTDFKMKTGQATSAMSGLNAIVANGKTHLQDIAASMSKVLPTASALHVSFGQVGGAMATMTGEGISAKMAAMGLNSAILALAAPNAVATKSMNELGMSTKDYAKYQELVKTGNTKAAGAMMAMQGTAKEVANTLTHQGLIAALAKVADLALQAGPRGSAAYVGAMKAMMGGNKGLQVALALTGQNLETSTANVAKVSGAVKNANKDVTGWSVTQATLSNRLGQFKEIVQVSAVQLGTLLIPVLTMVVTGISKLIQGFISLPGPVKMALLGVAIAILAVVAPWMTLIAGIIFGAALIANHWASIKALTIKVWGDIRDWFVNVWHDIYSKFGFYLDAIVTIWRLDWLVVSTYFKITFLAIETIAKVFWDVLTAIFKVAIALLTGNWTAAWNAIKGVGVQIWNAISTFFKGALHDFATAFSTAISIVVGYFRAFGGKILSALGAFGSLLVNVGKSFISGLFGGITSALSGIRSWVQNNIFNPIIGAIKFLFGVRSPSTVMASIGGHLVGGLILGLLKTNPTAMITKIFGSLPLALGSLVEKGLVNIAKLPAKALSALSGLGSKLLAVLGLGGKGASANVQGWLDSALMVTGKPLSWLDPLQILVGKESGGSPTAVDPISVLGQHATGLLQMLPSTFAAYAMPGFANILNPLDNAIASIRYISAQYGSPMNIPGLTGGSYVGYDQGGLLMPGFHMVANMTGKPEQVIPAGGLGGGVTVNIYAHPSNNPDEIYEQVWQGLRNLRKHKGNQALGLG
jgi:TP901 family phage tail tape measure protein